MEKNEYLLKLDEIIVNFNNDAIAKDISDVKYCYSQLRACSIAKIKRIIRFSCLKVMEIVEEPELLIINKEFLKELETEMEPK